MARAAHNVTPWDSQGLKLIDMSLLQPNNRKFISPPHLCALPFFCFGPDASVNLRPVNGCVVEAVLTRCIVLCNFGVLRIVMFGTQKTL
jgi:hypothetical protein